MAGENSEKVNAKLGKRIMDMLKSNTKISDSIKKLEKICDGVYEKDSWEKAMVLEWAYSGCILTKFNGGDPVKRLEAYVTNIEETLKHNKYSDPAFYIPEIYNVVFK